MTTTQELIGCVSHDCAACKKQADALEALQAEMAQAKFSYMDGYEGGKQEARDASHEEIKGLTAERDSSLARERHTRETLHKFMSAAGASPELDALQTEVARLQACGNGAGCCYKASTFEALEVDKEALQAENAKQATDHIKIVDAIAKQRDAALARLAATEKQEPVGYVLSCGDLTMSIIREKGYYKDQEMSLFAAAGASPQPVQPSQAWDALREWGCTGKDMSLATIMQRGDDLANALRNRCAQPVQPAAQLRLETALERAGAAESALRRLVDECENENIPGWEDRMIECIDSANKLLAAQPAQPSPARELSDEETELAVAAWFKEPIQSGRYPFAKRMRAAIAAINTKETK